MKVVILAGGLGTRITEESHLKPKPMITVGNKPILWHIMKLYSHYNFNEFIICCGYKGYVIKEYFYNYYLHNSDVTFDFTNNNEMIMHNNKTEPWKVTLVDTGLNTMTGGRIKRIKEYIGDDKMFFATYGDGVSDVNIQKLLDFHKAHNKIATITTINPSGRFGVVEFENDSIRAFNEKPETEDNWINAGFFVFNREIFDYIDNDEIVLEREPFNTLSEHRQMKGFKHNGFWQCMDNMRDNNILNQMWNENRAKWKVWSE